MNYCFPLFLFSVYMFAYFLLSVLSEIDVSGSVSLSEVLQNGILKEISLFDPDAEKEERPVNRKFFLHLLRYNVSWAKKNYW